MVRSAKTLWPVLALAAVVALLSLGANGCPPQPLEPGTDCWHTETGTKQRLPTLPEQTLPDFDGKKSNAIPNQWVELTGLALEPGVVSGVCGCPKKVEYTVEWQNAHGETVGSESIHKVKQVRVPTTDVDTCIRRTVRADVQKKGVAAEVKIELVKLSLRSVKPIEVTYGTGPPPTRTKKSFDVFITESATQQKVGKMTLTTNTIASGKANGDVLLGNLFVNYDVTLREVGTSNEISPDKWKDLSLRFADTKGRFVR